jgi:hypothetical protein
MQFLHVCHISIKKNNGVLLFFKVPSNFAPPHPHTTTTLLPWHFNMLFELVQTFILFFIYTLARSYLLVLLCSFACPADAVYLYPDLRLFFTCLPSGFEPGTWGNIIVTTMPSQFHLISSYLRASPMVPKKIIVKSMGFSCG